MRNRDARIAGLFYLAAIVAGWFTLMYVPDKLIVTGDAVATAQNILANPSLFRAGMVGDLVTGVVWLGVVLALYRLLGDVDRTQANLMVVLGAFLQVPLYFVNVVNYVAALLLVQGAPFLSVFSEGQRDALAMLFLRLHHFELLASFVFAGLWLFPFGVLVYKSGFLPRVLGIWLVLDCFAWLAISLNGFLTPQYAGIVGTITFPITFAEVAITLWLLVAGARPSPSGVTS
jgi:membrane-bound metal-dependent hydrolase YbcI (DUF457 family)